MEERSGSFLPELPYTNRGVIRQKEELSALIDWCHITVKEVPLEAVIEDVLRIPLELMTVTGYEKVDNMDIRHRYGPFFHQFTVSADQLY